jgi:hypothetical protein
MLTGRTPKTRASLFIWQRLALYCECKQSGASNSAYLTRALTRFAKGRSEKIIYRSRQQNYRVVVVAGFRIWCLFFFRSLSHILCPALVSSNYCVCLSGFLKMLIAQLESWFLWPGIEESQPLFNPPSLTQILFATRSFLSPKQSGTRRTKPYFGKQLNQSEISWLGVTQCSLS